MEKSEAQKRKRVPIYSGVIKYFPEALKVVARVSWVGNEQHNPGEPLHWARGKSMDQLDAALRHITDYAEGTKMDTDGVPHLGKAAWRLMAQLELDEEQRIDEEENGTQA